jgi:hypothetical protein
MEPSNLHVLVEAKTEYTKTLISILTPRLREGIFSIFQESLTHCRDTNTTNQLLVTFQKYLSSIPRWSDYMIEEEFERIQRLSKCDYIEDLITAVFVSHTKILTSIRSGSRIKKIDLTIPKPQTFIHKAYIECARLFWKQPYVFILSTKYSEDMEISKIKQQQNYRECEKIIEEALNETIRKMLPVKSILSTYLGESVNDLISDNIEDDGLNHDIVKSLVEKELEKHNREQLQLDTENETKDNTEEDTKDDKDKTEEDTQDKTEENKESNDNSKDNQKQNGGNYSENKDESKENEDNSEQHSILNFGSQEDNDNNVDGEKDNRKEKENHIENTEERNNTSTPTLGDEISILEPIKLVDSEEHFDNNVNTENKEKLVEAEAETKLENIDSINDIVDLNSNEITLNLDNIPTVSTENETTQEETSPQENIGNIENIGSVLQEVKNEVEKEKEKEIPSENSNTDISMVNENISFQPGIQDNEGKTEAFMSMYDDDDDEDEDQPFRIVSDSIEDITDGITDIGQDSNINNLQDIDIDSIPTL